MSTGGGALGTVARNGGGHEGGVFCGGGLGYFWAVAVGHQVAIRALIWAAIFSHG